MRSQVLRSAAMFLDSTIGDWWVLCLKTCDLVAFAQENLIDLDFLTNDLFAVVGSPTLTLLFDQ